MKIVRFRNLAAPPRLASRRLRVPVVLVAPMAAAVVAGGLITGCGGSGSSGGGVAHIQSSTTRTGHSKASSTPSAMAFSQCMRSHGVPNFPDPNSSGKIELSQGSGINPNSSGFQSASNDCKSLNPAGTVSPAQSNQSMSKALKVAQCFRENGVPNFPDPKSVNSGVQIGGSGIDPSSPAFQRAQAKCGPPLF